MSPVSDIWGQISRREQRTMVCEQHRYEVAVVVASECALGVPLSLGAVVNNIWRWTVIQMRLWHNETFKSYCRKLTRCWSQCTGKGGGWKSWDECGQAPWQPLWIKIVFCVPKAAPIMVCFPPLYGLDQEGDVVHKVPENFNISDFDVFHSALICTCSMVPV